MQTVNPSRMRTAMFAPTQLVLLLTTQSSTFDFQNTPLHFGIRHIHTPEHFTKTHPLTFPNFRILPGVSNPIVHKGCSLVSFDFEVGFVPRRFSALMFSSHCCRSQLLIFDSKFKSCADISLSVTSHGVNGHSLRVHVTPYVQVSRLAAIGARLWHHVHNLEDVMFWGYDADPIQKNMRKYRLCVMHPEMVEQHKNKTEKPYDHL